MSLFLFPFLSIGYVMLLCLVSPLIKCTVVCTDRSASVSHRFIPVLLHPLRFCTKKGFKLTMKEIKILCKTVQSLQTHFSCSIYAQVQVSMYCKQNNVVIFFWIPHILYPVWWLFKFLVFMNLYYLYPAVGHALDVVFVSLSPHSPFVISCGFLAI